MAGRPAVELYIQVEFRDHHGARVCFRDLKRIIVSRAVRRAVTAAGHHKDRFRVDIVIIEFSFTFAVSKTAHPHEGRVIFCDQPVHVNIRGLVLDKLELAGIFFLSYQVIPAFQAHALPFIFGIGTLARVLVYKFVFPGFRRLDDCIASASYLYPAYRFFVRGEFPPEKDVF